MLLIMVYSRRKPSNKRARPGLTPKPFQCRHWWLFEEPDGPSVIGTCLKCGATQEIVSFWESDQRVPTTQEMEWANLSREQQRQYCTPAGEWKGATL